MAPSGPEAGPVTWEAADKGASCALGCLAGLCLLTGGALALWSLTGGIWKLILALPGLVAGAGLVAFLRSPWRGRWEVTFDPGERTITVLTRVHGRQTVQVIGFDEVAGIELEPIARRTSGGEIATFYRPVLQRKEGRAPLRLDERLSVRDAEHAREVLQQMRALWGGGTSG